jgi:hypothetical protein
MRYAMRLPSAGPNARRRTLVPLLLCVALLWAQGLGLLHRIAHGPLAHAAPGIPAATVDAAVAAHGEAGWRPAADALTGHTHDGVECWLFDHTTGADLLVAAVAAVSADPPGHGPPAIDRETLVVAAVAHALPRGPPLRS